MFELSRCQSQQLLTSAEQYIICGRLREWGKAHYTVISPESDVVIDALQCMGNDKWRGGADCRKSFYISKVMGRRMLAFPCFSEQHTLKSMLSLSSPDINTSAESINGCTVLRHYVPDLLCVLSPIPHSQVVYCIYFGEKLVFLLRVHVLLSGWSITQRNWWRKKRNCALKSSRRCGRCWRRRTASWKRYFTFSAWK